MMPAVHGAMTDPSRGPERAAPPTEPILQYREIRLELLRLRLKVDGEIVKVSVTEFTLMQILLLNVGRIMTREELARQLWPEKPVRRTAKSVDTRICMLRRALRAKGADALLRTIRGHGYMLE